MWLLSLLFLFPFPTSAAASSASVVSSYAFDASLAPASPCWDSHTQTGTHTYTRTGTSAHSHTGIGTHAQALTAKPSCYFPWRRSLKQRIKCLPFFVSLCSLFSSCLLVSFFCVTCTFYCLDQHYFSTAIRLICSQLFFLFFFLHIFSMFRSQTIINP